MEIKPLFVHTFNHGGVVYRAELVEVEPCVYSFNVSASYVDIQIFTIKRLSNSFSWSEDDGVDLADYAIENLNEDMHDIIKYTEERAERIISSLTSIMSIKSRRVKK